MLTAKFVDLITQKKKADPVCVSWCFSCYLLGQLCLAAIVGRSMFLVPGAVERYCPLIFLSYNLESSFQY